MTSEPIVLVGGGKGGVGKSMVSMALLDHLTGMGEEVLLVETDTSAPDVWKAYRNEVPSQCVDLEQKDGWLELLDTLLMAAGSLPEHRSRGIRQGPRAGRQPARGPLRATRQGSSRARLRAPSPGWDRSLPDAAGALADVPAGSRGRGGPTLAARLRRGGGGGLPPLRDPRSRPGPGPVRGLRLLSRGRLLLPAAGLLSELHRSAHGGLCRPPR
jgi:hypothetical protein